MISLKLPWTIKWIAGRTEPAASVPSLSIANADVLVKEGASSRQSKWTQFQIPRTHCGVEPKCICGYNGVPVTIAVGIQAAAKPDGITFNIPSGDRIVVSEVVVVRSAAPRTSYNTAISPVLSRTYGDSWSVGECWQVSDTPDCEFWLRRVSRQAYNGLVFGSEVTAMSDVILRRPIRDQELERFEQAVDEAVRMRLTRAEFLGPQVIEERDVLVYCLNRGGVPGKRYRYEAGWIEAFRHDLHECYFLAA